MLLAELHRKLRSTFGCNQCGNTDAWSPETALAMEDVLTSNVFGALRYLPVELGLGPIFRRVGLEPGPTTVEPWPQAKIRSVRLGTSSVTALDCEPDVVLDGDERGICVVEVKLRSILGDEATQLPREAIVAHGRAAGRPWRLLCVTAGTVEPRHPSFEVLDGRLVQGPLQRLNDAVASYFEATRRLGCVEVWPEPEQVQSSVHWMSWSDLANLLDVGLQDAELATHSLALLSDLLTSLRDRGLLQYRFRGFTEIRAQELVRLRGLLWYRPRVPRKLVWGNSTLAPWPRLVWISARRRSAARFRGFLGGRRPAVLAWPGGAWGLAACHGKVREAERTRK